MLGAEQMQIGLQHVGRDHAWTGLEGGVGARDRIADIAAQLVQRALESGQAPGGCARDGVAGGVDGFGHGMSSVVARIRALSGRGC
jgi:hypothetical protein